MADHQCSEHDHHHHHGEGHDDHHEGHGHPPITPEYWLKYWDSKEGRELNFPETHECLVKYEDLLMQGKKNVKILVPLCGKTYDMKWLADKGHDVVGIELSPVAVQQFFELNNIEYTMSKQPSTKLDLYKSKSGNIRIYCGDLFLFSKDVESDFGAVWDAAAMHSLPKNKRAEYVDVVKSLMSPQCQYLVEDDVPCCSDAIKKSDLQTVFGPQYTIDELGFTKTEIALYKEWEIEGFNIFHIHC